MTVLNEFYRIAFRKKLYASIAGVTGRPRRMGQKLQRGKAPKAVGVSARPRCKLSLTPSPLRGERWSPPEHDQTDAVCVRITLRRLPAGASDRPGLRDRRCDKDRTSGRRFALRIPNFSQRASHRQMGLLEKLDYLQFFASRTSHSASSPSPVTFRADASRRRSLTSSEVAAPPWRQPAASWLRKGSFLLIFVDTAGAHSQALQKRERRLVTASNSLTARDERRAVKRGTCCGPKPRTKCSIERIIEPSKSKICDRPELSLMACHIANACAPLPRRAGSPPPAR